MRANNSPSWYQQTYGDTYITTVNNITQVNNDHHYSRNKRRARSFDNKRRPELLGFCSSFGIVDREKVYGMPNGKIMKELCNVGSYTSKNIASDVKGIGNSLCRIARGIAGIFGL